MSDDPIRWAEGGGPPGGADLVRSLRRPPPLPPDLRALGRARAPARLSPRWIGPTLATAVIVGGLVLWVLHPAPSAPPPIESTPIESLTDEVVPRPAQRERVAPSASIAPEVAPIEISPAPETSPERSPAPPIARRGSSELGTDTARADETARAEEAPGEGAPEPSADESSFVGTGYLMAQTLPWARVWIDGRDTGQLTPVRRMPLPAGRHVVAFVTNDGARSEVAIEVRAGETVRIVRQLAAPAAPAAALEDVAVAPLPFRARELEAVIRTGPGTEPEPTLAATPSRTDVVGAMGRVSSAVSACSAGQHGTATVAIVVDGSTGRVTSARVGGQLAGTPVAACIARAVSAAVFPRFSRDSFTINYPFRL